MRYAPSSEPSTFRDLKFRYMVFLPSSALLAPIIPEGPTSWTLVSVKSTPLPKSSSSTVIWSMEALKLAPSSGIVETIAGTTVSYRSE